MHESLKVYLKDSFVGWLSHETAQPSIPNCQGRWRWALAVRCGSRR